MVFWWTVYVWCVVHGMADVGVSGACVVFMIVKVVPKTGSTDTY